MRVRLRGCPAWAWPCSVRVFGACRYRSCRPCWHRCCGWAPAARGWSGRLMTALSALPCLLPSPPACPQTAEFKHQRQVFDAKARQWTQRHAMQQGDAAAAGGGGETAAGQQRQEQQGGAAAAAAPDAAAGAGPAAAEACKENSQPGQQVAAGADGAVREQQEEAIGAMAPPPAPPAQAAAQPPPKRSRLALRQ